MRAAGRAAAEQAARTTTIMTTGMMERTSGLLSSMRSNSERLEVEIAWLPLFGCYGSENGDSGIRPGK